MYILYKIQFSSSLTPYPSLAFSQISQECFGGGLNFELPFQKVLFDPSIYIKLLGNPKAKILVSETAKQ